MKKLNSGLAAKLDVLVSGILWGFTGLFVRTLTGAGVPGLVVVAIRSLLAAVILAPIMLIKNPNLLKIRPRDIWCFVGTGIISMLSFNFCYFTGMSESLPVAAALMYTSPAFILIMSAFIFREKVTVRKLTALIVIAAGSALSANLFGGTAVVTTKGLLLGLGSGFAYALYSIFGRFALEKGYNSMTVSFYTFAFAGVAGFPFCLPYLTVELLQPKYVINGILLSILCTILPYLFYTKGLEGVETGLAGMLATVELVVASLVGVFLLGDKLPPVSVVGIALIFIGVVLINLPTKKKE